MLSLEWAASTTLNLNAIGADVSVFKERFTALYGAHKMRPDVVNQWDAMAQNLVDSNVKFYKSLFDNVFDPYVTYSETSGDGYTDTNSGDDVTKNEYDSQTENKNELGSTVTDTTKYGRTDTTDMTDTNTPGVTRQNESTHKVNAYNGAEPTVQTIDTDVNKPLEGEDVVKRNGTVGASGTDTNTRTGSGTDTLTSKHTGTDTNTLTHGHVLTHNGNGRRSGYNIKDVKEAMDAYYGAYDRLCADVHRLVCVCVATGSLDFSLDW